MNDAVSKYEHLVDTDVLSTVTTLVAGALAGQHYLATKLFRDGITGERADYAFDAFIDMAIDLHLTADKPFDELMAGYAQRRAAEAVRAAQPKGMEYSDIPSAVLDAVGGDTHKLDKQALEHLQACDKAYRARRADIYTRLASGDLNVVVGF